LPAEPLLPTVEGSGHRPQRSLLRSVLLALYTALTGAYGLSVAGFLLLHFGVGERWTLVALFNTFLHLLLMPSVVLLPVSLLLRRWVAALLVVPAFAAFALAYGGQFLPKGGASADVPSFTLLTYNMRADNAAIRDVEAVIRSANADIVAVQELNIPGAALFSESFRDVYPYQALHPQADYSGQGIFSRYPISADDYWQIVLGHQRAIINLNRTSFALYNAHPVQPWATGKLMDTSVRQQELDSSLERAAKETMPTLIVGDFNMTDWAADYRRITAQYADSYREAGWGMGFTFPAFSVTNQQLAFLPPLARIDYVFHDRSFWALEATVLPDTGGSDHHPLLVRLALKG
jgi:vancomycin resistance protein VanJ